MCSTAEFNWSSKIKDPRAAGIYIAIQGTEFYDGMNSRKAGLYV